MRDQMTRFLPLFLFAAMALLFAVMLTDEERNPKQIKSALIGKAAPSVSLKPLYEGQKGIDTEDFQISKPIVVNFFASWCIPCRAEHDNLMKLAAMNKITLYGIAHKDKPQDSRKFLDQLGNPYDRIGVDLDGFQASIDFGISGVPETFIINGKGIITYRHWGPIIGDQLTTEVLPAIEEAFK
ncbi:DsbE family thiol:disulfide interchange protein [Temperatibacter marinus]|uniref:DsbE family thiol:disulfide interchange protein n=1 Tax=Temperatibacter marinus TaxID=1456591 RepID=A0AA52EJA7_9PROT|nr:DsbE family thiol:disulfide interchange protein [Temperatibacter marinus]WND03071.1 DsbE family thiol:disulfide interchange protein [Temperatibacter marinus]